MGHGVVTAYESEARSSFRIYLKLLLCIPRFSCLLSRPKIFRSFDHNTFSQHDSIHPDLKIQPQHLSLLCNYCLCRLPARPNGPSMAP